MFILRNRRGWVGSFWGVFLRGVYGNLCWSFAAPRPEFDAQLLRCHGHTRRVGGRRIDSQGGRDPLFSLPSPPKTTSLSTVPPAELSPEEKICGVLGGRLGTRHGPGSPGTAGLRGPASPLPLGKGQLKAISITHQVPKASPGDGSRFLASSTEDCHSQTLIWRCWVLTCRRSRDVPGHAVGWGQGSPQPEKVQEKPDLQWEIGESERGAMQSTLCVQELS
ncbi:PREDICTED: uncharacterized protein LOC101817547 [Ficedula albicollis]|uniref:uncharacterized protein LOC101817547 n=1 Tax=Ficedula albicollis TaxID=59894 RepID=UPI0003596C55|nr:PREDICTED: uncharacterized protein LOC101817547 [Ficedula albicollis]